MGSLEPNKGQLRDAYVPSRRVRFASDVAGLCAVLLLIGLVGAAFSWWGRSDLFDLASNEREAVKMDIGFLAGPVLILIALPLVIGRARQVALTQWFRARLLLASLLWVAGLVILVAKVNGLDSSYSVEAGTYVSAGLMAVGLLATLAMWPVGLATVRVDRNGLVREPTAAAAQPARSPTGP